MNFFFFFFFFDYRFNIHPLGNLLHMKSHDAYKEMLLFSIDIEIKVAINDHNSNCSVLI